MSATKTYWAVQWVVEALYCFVIKHDEHLRTRRKWRKHSPAAPVFSISLLFSNVRSVLSQCNTQIRLLHLLYDMEVMWRKCGLYSGKPGVFDQSGRAPGPIYIINMLHLLCKCHQNLLRFLEDSDLSIVCYWLWEQLGPGMRFSKDPRTLRARKAFRKTSTRLFCKPDLFICCKGNKN